MTPRERFVKYMKFGRVDRVPLMEMGTWPETLTRWYGEGLPPWVRELRHLEDHLQLDISFNNNWLPVHSGILPEFRHKVLEEDQNTRLVRDSQGVVLREIKDGRSIPQYVKFPVETEADYEALRPRLDGASPGRYPETFDDDLHWRRVRGEIVGLHFRSFFGFPRGLMGAENWCMAFYDQPGLVRRVIADRLQFAKDCYRRVLATGAVDFVQVWEDMSYKTASLISPKHVREFMLPAYIELVSFLREHGVQVIMVDTDGKVDDLLPIFLEAGMDGTHPCEVAAGSDPVSLRERFANAALMGGMDKRAIAAGRDGIDAELRRIAPALAQGGYIPMLDHFVPPDVSWDDYRYYVDRRRELLARPA